MTTRQIIWTIIAIVIIGLVLVLTRHPASKEPEENPALEGGTTSAPLESTNPNALNPTSTSPAPSGSSGASHVTMKDNMKIETTKEGSGPAIASGQTAVVNYTGTLADGTTFDSNIDPKFQHVEPFSFTLGAGQVIKGWDEGVAGMKVGETRTLTIPPELAYGASGVPGAIPPNATLTFVVTLTAIK